MTDRRDDSPQVHVVGGEFRGRAGGGVVTLAQRMKHKVDWVMCDSVNGSKGTCACVSASVFVGGDGGIGRGREGARQPISPWWEEWQRGRVIT